MTALDEETSIAQPTTERPSSMPKHVARTLITNSTANVARIAVTALVSILLPAYLTHHLPVTLYSAWILILQLSAYVGYLDLGVQTAVSKYIAEYDAKQDVPGCGRCASAGLMIMLGAGVLGLLLTAVLAWQVPVIFHKMPDRLYGDVRLSILFVGSSLSVSLATSVFVAIFLGLQRYHVPMVITMVSRLLFGAVICLAVALHSSLAVMGAAAACVNLLTALLQIEAWRRRAQHIRVSLRLFDAGMLKKMINYCGVLSVWSVCMLFVGGLDLTIVGHYAFSETAYYAIAASPTSLILMVIAALMGPLLPATSALSVLRTPAQMGSLLLKTTRYATTILLLTGMPIIVIGYLVLRLWVGPVYALHSVLFLRVLVIANLIRNLCSPYATMVVATNRQRVATAAAVSEGVVNLSSSLWLVQHVGAVGVALGTLLGAIAGVAVHFGVSMLYTRTTLGISRADLFLKGMCRPATVGLPSLLLVWFWWRSAPPAMTASVYIVWITSTLLFAWYVAFDQNDRAAAIRLIAKHADILQRPV